MQQPEAVATSAHTRAPGVSAGANAAQAVLPCTTVRNQAEPQEVHRVMWQRVRTGADTAIPRRPYPSRRTMDIA